MPYMNCTKPHSWPVRLLMNLFLVLPMKIGPWYQVFLVAMHIKHGITANTLKIETLVGSKGDQNPQLTGGQLVGRDEHSPQSFILRGETDKQPSKENQ